MHTKNTRTLPNVVNSSPRKKNEDCEIHNVFLIILPPSQNRCNYKTGHANQYRCKMTKLPLVFCEKDLDMSLSFVWRPFRVSCLLWLVDKSCILYETNFKLWNCIYFGTGE
jgi:hypothetical protein